MTLLRLRGLHQWTTAEDPRTLLGRMEHLWNAFTEVSNLQLIKELYLPKAILGPKVMSVLDSGKHLVGE